MLSGMSFFQMAASGLLSEEKRDLLVEKTGDLIEKLKLSPSFWATLVKNNVILTTQIDEMKVGSRLCFGDLICYDIITCNGYIC